MRIAQVRARIDELNDELRQLKNGCTHTIVKKYGSAVCDICGKEMGWYCPDSPDHICDYEQEDGEYDEDSCRYCGHPDERK
jgi:DNA-directed RNA polymerase subunit RPC12/RpoP